MSISKQLMTMLAIAILGIFAVFSTGMIKMDTVFKTANQANTKTIPAILAMGDVQQSFYKMRVATWQHLFNKDKVQLDKVEAQFKEFRKEFEVNLKKYEPYISDSKDQEYYNKEKELYEQYKLFLDKLLVISAENRKDDALAFIAPNLAMINGLIKTIDDHMDYNQQLAQKNAQEAISIEQNAVYLMIILSLLVVAGVVIFSFIIRNNIMQGVSLIRDSISGFVANKNLKFKINYDKKMK